MTNLAQQIGAAVAAVGIGIGGTSDLSAKESTGTDATQPLSEMSAGNAPRAQREEHFNAVANQNSLVKLMITDPNLLGAPLPPNASPDEAAKLYRAAIEDKNDPNCAKLCGLLNSTPAFSQYSAQIDAAYKKLTGRDLDKDVSKALESTPGNDMSARLREQLAWGQTQDPQSEYAAQTGGRNLNADWKAFLEHGRKGPQQEAQQEQGTKASAATKR